MATTRIQVRNWHYGLPFRINLFQDGVVVDRTLTCKLGEPAPKVETASEDYWLEGWYLDAEFSRPIDLTQPMPYLEGETLYGKWTPIDFANGSHFTVNVTSQNANYNTFQIYSATRASGSNYIYIDWGDGSEIERVTSISQNYHTYTTNGTYHPRISNDITTFALNASAAYSRNQYALTEMNQTGTKVTSLGQYFCFRAANLNLIDIGANVTTINTQAFYRCTNVKTIYSRRSAAPTCSGNYSFVRASTNQASYACGYNGRNSGTNILHVPRSNSGYGSASSTTQWGYLQSTTYGGFKLTADL